jgi:hypothetical protein
MLDRKSGRGLEFCHSFRVGMRYPDLPQLFHKGGRSGQRRHVRKYVEVTPSVVFGTEGFESASLASMARVMGSVSS